MVAVETVVNSPEKALDPSDEGEFVRLYRDYGSLALYQIQRIVRDRGVSEELLQDAMLAAANRRHTFDGSKGSMGTWFLTIARNRAIDHVRSNSSRLAQHSVPVSSCDRPEPSWILSEIESDDQARMVRAAVKLLPQAQRMAIELCFFEDLSGSQIALKLGVPLGTVKTRMRSALKNLRNHLVRGDAAFNRAA